MSFYSEYFILINTLPSNYVEKIPLVYSLRRLVKLWQLISVWTKVCLGRFYAEKSVLGAKTKSNEPQFATCITYFLPFLSVAFLGTPDAAIFLIRRI